MKTVSPKGLLPLSICALVVGCGGGNSAAPLADSAAEGSELPPPLMTCVTDKSQIPVDPGLPSVASGPRPGPDILYAPAPQPAVLQNHDPRFRAQPILVQGAEAYVDGEYLYQDYIYDDYGSDVSNDDLNEIPVTVGNSGLNGLEQRVGDIDYPTNFDRYGGNAADLVEFRISHGDSDIAYRVTLNTLLEPDTTMVAIAFDMDTSESTGVATLSRDPGLPFPGTDEVIYLWGSGAEHVRFTPDGSVTSALPITTRLDANQMWVTVPRAIHDPSGKVAVTVAAGLYDLQTGGWLMPLTSAPTETQPGTIKQGLFDSNPSAVFNLGFRFNEPIRSQNTPPDTLQSAAIRSKDMSPYKHVIAYDDLAQGINRDNIPAVGTQNRILASHFSVNRDGTINKNGTAEGRDLSAEPDYLGVLQPYALYIPQAAETGQPLPIHWAFHSNAQEHWQYNGSTYVQQIGEALNAFVPTTLGRSPTNWYDNEAEADVFEVWADIARHFNVDANRVAATGYSMGGYASYRLPMLYPDLFGKAFTQVGPPGEGMWLPPNEPTAGASTLTNRLLENVRHIPYMNIAAALDELVPYPGPQAQNLGNPLLGIRGFADLDYQYRFLSFPTAEHYTLFLLDNYPMATEFLKDVSVDRNPARVTYSYLPAEDNVDYGLIHDHAYWVSDIALANSNDAAAKGTVDAISHACGYASPTGTPGATAGFLPLPYAEVNNTWGDAPVTPPENKLSLSLTNVAALRLDLARSGIDIQDEVIINISSDSPGSVMFEHNAAVFSYETGQTQLILR